MLWCIYVDIKTMCFQHFISHFILVGNSSSIFSTIVFYGYSLPSCLHVR